MNAVPDVNRVVIRKEVEMKALLKVNNLCKKNILKNISFSVDEGEMIAIMGPSGSGKSTLLYNVSGMDQADPGLTAGCHW